jgi:hypothetical protein
MGRPYYDDYPKRKAVQSKWVLKIGDGPILSYTENEDQLKNLYEKKLIIEGSEIYDVKEKRVVPDEEILRLIKK